MLDLGADAGGRVEPTEAGACGAQTLITACPLCMYNLQKSAGGELPVRYFTELLAQALGLEVES